MSREPAAAGESYGALLAPLAVGIAGDLLLAWPLGVGAAIAAAGGVAVFVAVHRASIDAPRGLAAAAALSAAAGLAWRDAPVLHALDLLLLAGSLGLLGSAATTRASLVAYGLRLIRTAAYTALGAPPLVGQLPWSRLRSSRHWRLLFALGRGLLLAGPVVLVFALLLASADAVFALRLRALLAIDVEALAVHVLVAAALAWLAAGLLSAGAPGGVQMPGTRPAWLATGAIEAVVVLGFVDLLFGGFVWVQVRYLFGGASWMGAVAGLTYSQYARRGFFELVTVTALALPLLLLAHWVVRPGAKGRRAMLALAGVQVGLIGVMLASALVRMRLYQAEYGQTELRFYTTAFMLWLAVLLASFALTVLPGRRDLFAHAFFLSAWIVVALLHVSNPDARIVVSNLSARNGFDEAYALTLSADAAPALAAAVVQLDPDARARIDQELGRRCSGAPADWRAWNLGRARAAAGCGA